MPHSLLLFYNLEVSPIISKHHGVYAIDYFANAVDILHSPAPHRSQEKPTQLFLNQVLLGVSRTLGIQNPSMARQIM